MPLDFIAFFTTLLVLAVIGFGPALWVLDQNERRLPLSLGIAPVVGFTLIQILGFPLVRFIGPVQVWAYPLTIVLLCMSAALVFVQTRQQGTLKIAWTSERVWWLAVGLVLVCSLVLLAPF